MTAKEVAGRAYPVAGGAFVVLRYGVICVMQL
jgi:hypothetical protein